MFIIKDIAKDGLGKIRPRIINACENRLLLRLERTEIIIIGYEDH